MNGLKFKSFDGEFIGHIENDINDWLKENPDIQIVSTHFDHGTYTGNMGTNAVGEFAGIFYKEDPWETLRRLVSDSDES